ncbi:hypothetical protein J7E43_00515 [Bacillus sp. ISL-8]|nr:hypothetical protein [Bacillus sp. ISL-8]
MSNNPFFLMDKYRSYHKLNIPSPLKKGDKFQIKKYHLVIRNAKEAYNAHELPGQDYNKKHQLIKEYLNSDMKFNQNYFFCPLYFITVTPFDHIGEVKEGFIGNEQIVYIGETQSEESRFKKGHIATQLLNTMDFDKHFKFIFMTQVFVEYEHTTINGTNTYTVPLESFEKELPFNWAVNNKKNGIVSKIIHFLEKYLIFNLRPILNTKDNPIAYWLSKQEIITPESLTVEELIPEEITVYRSSHDRYPTNLLNKLELINYIKINDENRSYQREESLKIGMAAYTKSDYLEYFQEALDYGLLTKDKLKKLKNNLNQTLLSNILTTIDIDKLLED